MKQRVTAILMAFMCSISLVARAQEPNHSGVSVALVHLIVSNPEDHAKLWIDMLGAETTPSAGVRLLKVPGLFIALEKGEPSGPSNGSSVNHIGLWIRDHDVFKAKVVAAHLTVASDGYKAAECASSPGTPACQMTVIFSDGVSVELTEDRNLSTIAASHHIHMQATDPAAIREWYARTLGATAGFRRGVIPAALFEHGEVDFAKAAEPQAPSRGRSIDHFGLEVKNLEAYRKRLDDAGVKFEGAVEPIPGTKMKRAFITDPAGARIELIEGLGTN